jgi:hypothetical protein
MNKSFIDQTKYQHTSKVENYPPKMAYNQKKIQSTALHKLFSTNNTEINTRKKINPATSYADSNSAEVRY